MKLRGIGPKTSRALASEQIFTIKQLKTEFNKRGIQWLREVLPKSVRWRVIAHSISSCMVEIPQFVNLEYFFVRGQSKMFEFLFGFILGVWGGQTLPLPSVGTYVQSYFVPNVEAPPVSEEVNDEEEQPLFTGEIPTHVPSV